jgi:hypothetical protein
MEGLAKPIKNLRIADIPAENQTMHLPHTSLEHTARPTCLVPNKIWGLPNLLPTDCLGVSFVMGLMPSENESKNP